MLDGVYRRDTLLRSRATRQKSRWKRIPLNVTLSPIDATPEEIAQTLFQRPPLKKK